ncbi:Hypothetical_protein [Hexamita inflata]|uniref:Hypothetical_protein n=1 Tax=Hexamita inflata TaxID=28002 RepID=A0AA86TFK1_9EUKA|nr:Hypothetical protein HINF_LOCUS4874 [Hexamita inflata]
MSFIKAEYKLECIMVIIHLKQGNWVSSAAGLMITEPKKASWLWTGLKRLWHAVFFTLFHWSCLPAEFARPGGEAITCWRVGQATQVIDNGVGVGFAYMLCGDTSSNFPTLLKYSAKLMIFVQNFQDVRYEARELNSERSGSNYYILYYNRNCKLYFNLPNIRYQYYRNYGLRDFF